MNLKKLAQKTCANWIPGGICSGIWINPDLSLSAMIEEKETESGIEFFHRGGDPCNVNEVRCPYFEQFIIPFVEKTKKHPDIVSMEKAVATYKTKVMGQKNIRHCTRCKRPVSGMRPNEKFCADCKQKRKQESWRKSKRRSRCPQSEAVSEVI